MVRRRMSMILWASEELHTYTYTYEDGDKTTRET